MSTQTIIDSEVQIGKLDKSNMLGSLRELDKQVAEAWQKTSELSFSPTAEVRNVVIAGMGGSGLGADVIKTTLADELTVPFMIVNDYVLPNHVGQHSLVVLSSYSGTTEEILSCANEAKGRGAQIMVIAAGGDLLEFARKNELTHYHIEPTHNPSNQPRMAIGYSVAGTIGLLRHAGVFAISDEAIADVVATIEKTITAVDVAASSDTNKAKILAYLMLDRFPVFFGADFLAGGLHVATNQHNENAKTFATYHVIPEMNHHLLEGLVYPSLLQSSHVFIFVESMLNHARNQKRVTISQEIAAKAGIETFAIELEGSSKLAQTFELITLFGFAGFYLSMLEQIDPSPIPTVQNFKQLINE